MLPAEQEDKPEDSSATAAAASKSSFKSSSSSSSSSSSTYLGIDFGTSNSAAAIWDSTRGHPKWMRLGRHDLAATNSNKAGRVVPSAVLFVAKAAVGVHAAAHDDHSFSNHRYEDVSSILGRDDVVAFVGAAAMKITEQAAASYLEDNTTASSSSSSLSSSSLPYSSEQVSRALVTSVKRILGMKQQRKYNNSDNSDDDNNNKEWIESLPFELVTRKEHKTTPAATTKKDDEDDDDDDDDAVSIRVYPLGMTTSSNSITVTPEQVVAIILQSIRFAAQDYLQANMVKKKLQVPGGAAWRCTNCILGVPAHFGQAQRQTLLRAARLAGFDDGRNISSSNIANVILHDGSEQQQQEPKNGVGVNKQKKVVSVLTESTAAAMAYGLFVSAPGGGAKRRKDTKNDSTDVDPNATLATTTNTTTSVLVFDMGGGTTDVTIAEMTSAAAADDDDDESLMPRFEVQVTHGNAHLGGDDMDEALLRTVLTKLKKAKQQSEHEEHQNISFVLSPSEHCSLLRQCRSAKERLCGDVDHGLTKPEECVTITVTTVASSTTTGTKRIVVPVDITQQDLSQALEPCLARAELVVQTALERYAAMLSPSTATTTTTSCESSKSAAATTEKVNDHSPITSASSKGRLISEVVLVGGATRVLGVRDMLLRLFPPPPDLCLSVDAMSAVAQGTAIKAAMDSNCIPLHELRSAMMLDTTPHAIGVLLDSNYHDSLDKDETTTATATATPIRFVEIIPRDDPLPASGVATFQLANARQAGISLKAVEEVVELVEGGGGGDGEGSEKRQRQRRLLYPKLGDFTFLLHRLSEHQIAKLKYGIRSVDICMTLKENGALVVSFFDANDPEHVARRQKQQQQQNRRSKRDIASTWTSAKAVLEYSPSNDNNAMKNAVDDKDGFSKDQWILICYCIVLMVLYVAAKVVFRDELNRFGEE
jgi:molecular chaperone DnaK (HSP70)